MVFLRNIWWSNCTAQLLFFTPLCSKLTPVPRRMTWQLSLTAVHDQTSTPATPSARYPGSKDEKISVNGQAAEVNSQTLLLFLFHRIQDYNRASSECVGWTSNVRKRAKDNLKLIRTSFEFGATFSILSTYSLALSYFPVWNKNRPPKNKPCKNFKGKYLVTVMFISITFMFQPKMKN